MPGDSGHSIYLSKPAAGAFHTETMEPGGRHVLDFFPETATFENTGPDLRLTFDDGAVLVLANFYPALEQADFLLELPDGAALSGRDVEEALTLSIKDFSTDSGEGAQEGEIPLPPAADGLSFHPHDGEHGPLCHGACGLFDESHNLREDQDPLFTPRLSPLSQPSSPPAVPGPALAPGEQPGNAGAAGPRVPAGGEVLRLDDLLEPVKDDLAPGISQAPDFSLLGGQDNGGHGAYGSVASGAFAYGPIAPEPDAPSPGAFGFAERQGTLENPEYDWLIAFLRLG